jgi:hypothetical protein
MAMPARLDLSGDDMARLLDQVDALLTAAERGTARDRRSLVVPFRHAGDVFDAFDRKLITQEEARRLLGRPAREPSAARRKPPA